MKPHILDAHEWQYMSQGIAAAAVRLADTMAADHGQELILVRPPEAPRVELRYKGNPYRVGGGIDDPKREPPALSYARRLAQDALALERQIGRMIEQTLETLPADEREQLKMQLAAGGLQPELLSAPKPEPVDPLIAGLPPMPARPELN